MRRGVEEDGGVFVAVTGEIAADRESEGVVSAVGFAEVLKDLVFYVGALGGGEIAFLQRKNFGGELDEGEEIGLVGVWRGNIRRCRRFDGVGFKRTRGDP